MTSASVNKEEPQIGLYWYYKQKVFTHCLPLNSIEPLSNYVDLDVAHYEAWEFVIKDHPLLTAFEYDEIQRGRVIYLIDKNLFVVYSDETLIGKMKFKTNIIKVFNLNTCNTEFRGENAYCLGKKSY